MDAYESTLTSPKPSQAGDEKGDEEEEKEEESEESGAVKSSVPVIAGRGKELG